MSITSNDEQQNRRYVAIDLKSFYASVECVDDKLDPMDINLVVADVSRTEKTIVLAVSPSLKVHGIPGRPRLFEVVQKVKAINRERRRKNKNRPFTGKSYSAKELTENPSLELDYIVKPPRMARYMEVSRDIYKIYLKYISSKDMFPYSIDEVFIDVTAYLDMYKMTAAELARHMINDVYENTNITATAGVGTNMYLCKIAMDIMAKHMPADENGVRLAELDEMSYRRLLWDHRPLTDFWRVGRGYAKKLESYGIMTMGDIARCSCGKNSYYTEDFLYKLFGVNAELLIDHAWGWEPCTMEDVKNYSPKNNSICSGHVLSCPHTCEQTELIVKEMADELALDLMKKKQVTNQLVLTISYDIENLTNERIASQYRGGLHVDRYGRTVPEHAHGTINLAEYTFLSRVIVDSALELFRRIVNPILLSRKVTITANRVIDEKAVPPKVETREEVNQLDLFAVADEQEKIKAQEEKRNKEKKLQEALLGIQKRFGKNSILKGNSLQEGAVTVLRHGQIGGHRA